MAALALRRLLTGTFALAAVAAAAAVPASLAGSKAVGVWAYPSSTTIQTTGLPQGGARMVSLATGLGEQEDAIVLVRGGGQISVTAPPSIGPLPLRLFFAHYVSFDGTLVPDALLPWDGRQRAAETENQPVWLQLTVPAETPPGIYTGSVAVAVDGQTTNVPVSVRVVGVAIPPPDQVAGNLLTAFHVSGETYLGTVSRLNDLRFSEQRHAANPSLYKFLAAYRISPNSWGFAAPRSRSGYTRERAWFRSPATNMEEEVGSGPFAAMSVPVSNNRTAPHNYIASLSPNQPGTWCDYLRSVRTFWDQHGWLDSLPYVYGQDEPGLAGMHVVAQQAGVVHACFPGAKELMTGNPSRENSFLWDGQNGDDLDIWAVLASRFYGKYTVPLESRAGISHEHEKRDLIAQVRAQGRQIWTYNYAGTKTPSLTATEPLSDSRMLFLWTALEGIQGVLYGQGSTNYKGGNPYEGIGGGGASVLIYPSLGSPVPSARLEQIRDGIEDWAIFNLVRERRGAGAVRAILGGAGLFSATAKKVQLGCTIGCELKTETPFAWPEYSHDGSTPRRIETAKLQALLAAA